MGISLRHYLFLDDGSLRRVPQKLADALPFGRDAVPEFANTRQRVALVVVETKDARPLRILDAAGRYWTFDADGRVDRDLRERWAEHLDNAFAAADAKRGAVVDLVPEIERRAAEERNAWTLTADDLDRIAADLWPGINGPAPDVTSIKGAKPRKPPLTQEGRWALESIEKHIAGIASELDGLSERALKGLAFEAHRMGSIAQEALWQGVADEAKRHEAIRAAHRTGKCDWYAVVEVSRALRDHPHCWEEVAVVHEKCPSRKAAIEAGRRLMAEKADWVGEETLVEVSVRSALEWRPEDWTLEDDKRRLSPRAF